MAELLRYGHELKLSRAFAHLNELDVAIGRWIDSDAHRFWADADTDRLGYYFLKATVDVLPADTLSLVIGDVLQNMRSSLDHLAYELAAAVTKPMTNKIAEESQFPIIGDENRKGVTGTGETMFETAAAKMIAGVHRNAKTIIKGLQPFILKDKFRAHALWQLSVLSNIDKHRTLHVGLAASGGLGIVFPYQGYVPPFVSRDFTVYEGSLSEPGTIIAHVSLPSDTVGENGEVNVPVKPNYVVKWGDGLFPDTDVLRCLRDIYTYIGTEVFAALDGFLDPSRRIYRFRTL